MQIQQKTRPFTPCRIGFSAKSYQNGHIPALSYSILPNPPQYIYEVPSWIGKDPYIYTRCPVGQGRCPTLSCPQFNILNKKYSTILEV